jgi:phosphate transport system permease protein
MTENLTPEQAPGTPDPESAEDVPLVIKAGVDTADRLFRALLRGGGGAVFAITGLIAFFLILKSWSSFKAAGRHFLTTSQWVPAAGHFGIAAVLPDGVIIALVALVIAIPVAVSAAIFISEYAPTVLRKPLIAIIDLMAAIPSIVYALWGVFFLEPRAIGTIRWIADHLGAYIPIFQVRGGDAQSQFTASPFLAGMVVSLMVIPIATSICREVYSRAPVGEREAAYALGSSRWGMVRTVVLPYGRGGTIGAIMLGFGRAMGETIAVSLIISPGFFFTWRIFEHNGMSIPSLIALRATESTPQMLSALLAAGLVLFVVTLVINALAGMIVTRSRSAQNTLD